MRASRLCGFVIALASAVRLSGPVDAQDISGCVLLDTACNGVFDEADDPGIAGIEVQLLDQNGTYIESSITTDPGIHQPGGPPVGVYSFWNLQRGVYLVRIVVPDGLSFGTVDCNSAGCVDTSGNPAKVDLRIDRVAGKLNFLLCERDTPPPPSSLCWMTGGGVKFESITRTWNATSDSHGPTDNFGGVVYPSCSEFPSNGGQWNHIDHAGKVHLKGNDQTVIRCGNVDGHPPGTDSPVCGVNFIEWTGVGTIQGIGGNKLAQTPVTYFARVEDRNEPGNEHSATEGGDIDRYFLRAVDGDGNVLLLVDSDDTDDGAVDPLTITGGNLQIHCTSCEEEGGAAGVEVAQPRVIEPGPYFLRGDANTDGNVDLSDAVFALVYFFLGGESPRCFDAADANDDGDLNFSDPIWSLQGVFLGAAPMPAPYPIAGSDPSSDALDCDIFGLQTVQR